MTWGQKEGHLCDSHSKRRHLQQEPWKERLGAPSGISARAESREVISSYSGKGGKKEAGGREAFRQRGRPVAAQWCVGT